MCSGVLFPPSESESTKLQERLLREAAAFIITHQIPAFVRRFTVYILHMHLKPEMKQAHHMYVCVYVQVEYCLHSNEAPMDGASLKQALHQRGINLRYLGHVIKAISQSEQKERLRHITVCFVYRIAKLVLIMYLPS